MHFIRSVFRVPLKIQSNALLNWNDLCLGSAGWAVLPVSFLVHISRGTVTQLDAVHLLTKKIRQTEVEPRFWKLQQNKMENPKAELIMSSSKPTFITELNEQPRYLLLPPLFLCVILSFNKHLHFLSRRGHLVLALADQCHAYQGYVAVVPSVVVNQRGPIGHPCDLITVVPPRHYPGMLVCVLSQPVVGFPEVIQDIASAGKQSSFYSHQYKYWQGIDCIMINLGSQTKSFLYFPLPKRHSVPSLYSWA